MCELKNTNGLQLSIEASLEKRVRLQFPYFRPQFYQFLAENSQELLDAGLPFSN